MTKTVCIVQTNRGACETFAQMAAEVMPETRAIQVVDDGVLADINEKGGLTPSTLRRLFRCYQAAQDMGADAILHTCVVAAQAVDLIAPFIDIPVIRIDEAAARSAVEAGERIAVLATAATALDPSASLVERIGQESGRRVTVERIHLGEAVEALAHGDRETYERLAREAILSAAEANDAVLLAQPSMMSLLVLAEGAGAPVFAPGRNGFELLRQRIESN